MKYIQTKPLPFGKVGDVWEIKEFTGGNDGFYYELIKDNGSVQWNLWLGDPRESEFFEAVEECPLPDCRCHLRVEPKKKIEHVDTNDYDVDYSDADQMIADKLNELIDAYNEGIE